MFKQTPKKRVLFLRRLTPVLLAFFGVFSLLFVNLHAPSIVQAATSNTINFQARLQSAAGGIVPDGNYNVEFKLYTAASGGSALWTEDYTHSSGPSSSDVRLKTINGYFTTQLGSITAFPSTIDWSQQLWLTMNIGGTSTSVEGPSATHGTGWDGEMNPRLPLTAVPYAFQAGRAAQADELSSTSGSNAATLSIQAPTSGNQTFQIQDQGAAGTYNLLTTNQANAGYIQLQSGNPGTAQIGNLNITGTAIAGNMQVAAGGIIDTSAAGALNIGTMNATSLNIGTGNGNTNDVNVTVGSTSINSTISLNSNKIFTGGSIYVGTSSVPTGVVNGRITVLAGSATTVGEVIRLAASPTVDAFEIQDSTGACLYRINQAGNSGSCESSTGSTAGTTFRSGTTSAASSNSGATTVTTGNSTTSGNTGALVLSTGAATSGNSGAISIDSGTASGTTGAINIGTTNSSAINIGRSGIDTTVAGTLQASTIDTASAATLSIGTANANAISIGQPGVGTTINGQLIATQSVVISGSFTTTNNVRDFLTGTLNSSGTSSQYAFQNAMNFNPTGASLSNIYGEVDNPNISGSALNISNYIGVASSLSTSSGYTGTVGTAIDFQAADPIIGGSKLFGNYAEFAGNIISANSGNTSGTINNYGLSLAGATAAAASGGTLNNYGIKIVQPSGSGAGTTNNYGLYIQGNGGGSINYSVYNASTALSYFVGNIQSAATISANAFSQNGNTVCDSSNNCGLESSTGTDFIKNGTGSQTGNFNITGTGIAGALQAASLDTASAGALTFGGVNATSIVLGNVASGNYITFTAAGGLVASGTAQHAKTILLTPEYAGAVLDGQADSSCTSANSGTLTSGYQNGITGFGNTTQSYYSWVGASGATAECYDVVAQVPIPSDFSSWSSTTPLTINGYTTNTGNGTIALQVVNSAGTTESSCSYVGATPGSASTWTSAGSSCTFGSTTSGYTAGSYLTVRIRMTANATSTVRLGNLSLTYNSKY